MYPFDLKSGNKISNLLYKFISIKMQTHKIIIFDDNTLLPGIIGEDDRENIFKSKKIISHFMTFKRP